MADCSVLKPDAEGRIRHPFKDPLDLLELVVADGYRSSAPVHYATGTGAALLEVARLHVPIAEVTFVTACCLSEVPGARVSIDNEEFGVSVADGRAVVCSVACGRHLLQVAHPVLAPQGLCQELVMDGKMTMGVQVRLPLDQLRFVCVVEDADPDRAHLWLTADADLQRCAKALGGREAWLWEGELRLEGSAPLRVAAGVVLGTTEGFGENLPCSGDGWTCAFATGLLTPASTGGPWRVVLHVGAAAGRTSGCACLALATAPDAKRWVAQLVNERVRGLPGHRLCLRGLCCSGVSGVQASVEGVEKMVSATRRGAVFEIPLGDAERPRSLEVKLLGFSTCFLPDGVADFHARIGELRGDGCPTVTARYAIWVYWVPPDPVEEDAHENDGSSAGHDRLNDGMAGSALRSSRCLRRRNRWPVSSSAPVQWSARSASMGLRYYPSCCGLPRPKAAAIVARACSATWC